jgi:zeta-carotene desaturase
MQPDVVVIGGGVSGLTAAVDLSSHGFSVLLVEQKQYCGGRTHSFIHKETGDEVDNGQHLMMGCYRSTLKFLTTIGALSAVTIQKNLSVAFLHSERGLFRLQAVSLPAPLHVLVGLLRLKSLTFLQRLSLLRVGVALLFARPDDDTQLQSLTVSEWLAQLNQPEVNKTYLWDILAIGTLNDSPSVVSAALFVKVLRSAFLGRRVNSSMVIPKRGLSTVLVDPAVNFLTQKKSAVLTNTSVDRVVIKEGSVVGVVLNSGETVSTRAVISAVPYFDAPRIFREGTQLSELQSSRNFVSSAIVTVHLWFDKGFVGEEFVALLDSPIHWVFNKSKMYGRREGEISYLSLVISGAANIVEREKEEIVALAISELSRFYPRCADATLIHTLVIKEKRATFSPRVGVERFRPSHTTAVKNLFLAGDWTDTKLPATIEGAAQSGYACSALARRVLRNARDDRHL